MEKHSKTEGGPAGGRTLPDALPGLDIAEGIDRLGGERELYVEMVTEYCDAYGDFGTEFRELVSIGDLQSARRTAHSLKGAAGNISAKDLHVVAKALEHACTEETPFRILELLPPVEAALARVAASAKKMAALVGGARKNQPTVQERPLHDPGKLAAMFRGIAESLAASDPVQSGRYLEQIGEAEVPENLLAAVKDLKEQVHNYDFDAAADTLAGILRIFDA